MKNKVRSLIKQRIENYLENECDFRDYEFRSADQWPGGGIGIHRLRPTENDLDDAVDVFIRDGFPCIYIYI